MGLLFGVIKWLNSVFSLWGLAALLEEVSQGCGRKVNDGDTGCAAILVVEGSRLWNRGSQKESEVQLTLSWRNEAPKEKWDREQSWWWISGGKAGEPLHYSSFICNELRSQLWSPCKPKWPVLCSEGLSGFLFSKSSGQREMSIVSGYYWNTFPASHHYYIY